jgi:hypothetical protein
MDVVSGQTAGENVRLQEDTAAQEASHEVVAEGATATVNSVMETVLFRRPWVAQVLEKRRVHEGGPCSAVLGRAQLLEGTLEAYSRDDVQEGALVLRNGQAELRQSFPASLLAEATPTCGVLLAGCTRSGCSPSTRQTTDRAMFSVLWN